MKKILSAVLFALFILLPSCGGAGSDADSVAKKIEEKKTLDQKDYAAMIDYAAEAFDAVSKALEETKGNPAEMKKKAEELEKKYTHLELFMDNMPDEKDLDDANKKKLEDLTMQVIKMTMSSQMPVSADVPDAPQPEAPADSL